MKDPSSLFLLSREYVLRKIALVQLLGSLYLLVLDENTQNAVFKVISKDKLLRHVASVDLIDAKKRISAHIEVIYLIEASLYNFKCILGDVQTRRYRGGHLLLVPSTDSEAMRFFDSPRFLGDDTVSKFLHDGSAIHHIVSPLSPFDSRVCLAPSLTKNPLATYYNEAFQDLVHPQIVLAARSLVSLMVLTGEYPLVRYFSLPEATHDAALLPHLVAAEFQTQIDEYARSNHDFPPPSNGARLVLVITDRSMDPIVPLLHDFYYHAMAMDVVPSLLDTGKYSYSVETEAGDLKDVECEINNEDDDYWLELRHMHIADASSLIVNIVNTLIKKNPLMVDRAKAQTSSDLMYIVANLKGFDDERRRISLHKSLIDKCLATNEKSKLAEIASDFEQPCATGGTLGDGERVRDLHHTLIQLLSSSDLEVYDKLRLVLLYAQFRNGLVSLDLKKLSHFISTYHPAAGPAVASCIDNAYRAGVRLTKPLFKSGPLQTRFHSVNDEGTFSTLRFVPALSQVLQQAGSGQLDEDWFPYYRDKPLNMDSDNKRNSTPSTSTTNAGQLRNTRVKASWALSSSNLSTHVRGQSNRPKQRIFCYVAGGITYPEVQCIHDLSRTGNREYYGTSEAVLSPQDYIRGLQSLDPQNPQDLGARTPTRTGSPPPHVFEDGRTPPQVVTPVPQLKPTVQEPPKAGKEKEKKKSKLRGLFK